MADGFSMIILYLGVALAFTAALLILPLLLAPRRPTAAKNQPFECGQAPIGEGRTRFMMQYYPYLIAYTVFDVISMFLFAWAVSIGVLGVESSLPAVIFLVTLIPVLGYAIYLAGRRELW